MTGQAMADPGLVRTDFTDAVESGGFDAVIGDPVLKRAVPHFRGEWIPFVHFAVSGALEQEEER